MSIFLSFRLLKFLNNNLNIQYLVYVFDNVIQLKLRVIEFCETSITSKHVRTFKDLLSIYVL